MRANRIIPMVFILISPFALIGEEFTNLIRNKQKEAEGMLDDEFFRKILKESLQNAKEIDVSSIQRRNAEILENTSPCFLREDQKETYDVLVFASFSMPDTLWREYSESLTKIGGTFVLRGLPDDSFNNLATKIHHLKKRGVAAPILLDPKSFEKYQVETVPTIVLAKKDDFDKISGSVSLEYAIELFSKEGN